MSLSIKPTLKQKMEPNKSGIQNKRTPSFSQLPNALASAEPEQTPLKVETIEIYVYLQMPFLNPHPTKKTTKP